MKYREIVINQLKTLPYFNKEVILALGKQYNLKLRTIDSYIDRSLSKKDIISLRRGLYVTSEFYNENGGDISYTFYLANVLRAPSYVSSWSALQYYELTTEAIGTVTSVTSKITRANNNKAGSFSYQSINKKLFSDFKLVKGKFDFFIATPAKALFDLLYFKTNEFRGVEYSMIDGIVESLRVETEELDVKELEKFRAFVKKYILNKYDKPTVGSA